MAKQPKITLAARILLLKEHLETLRNDERDAGIEAHQAFEDVREALKSETADGRAVDWDPLRSRMWRSYAIHNHIKGQIDALRRQIELLES